VTRRAESAAVGGPIARWRAATLASLGHVEGLVHVLMKPRNGEAWTSEDRAFLRAGLRAAARWTPLLLLFLVPGSFFLLPVCAWILDRRRVGRGERSVPGRDVSVP
jgi:hypothetical protein